MMFQVVLVQFVVGLVVSAVAGVVGGAAAGWTALLGTVACTVPNGLFALNLAVLSQRRQNAARPQASTASALPVLAGEFGKVLLTVALLALVVRRYPHVNWPALIVAVGAVLLSQAFALAWRRT